MHFRVLGFVITLTCFGKEILLIFFFKKSILNYRNDITIVQTVYQKCDNPDTQSEYTLPFLCFLLDFRWHDSVILIEFHVVMFLSLLSKTRSLTPSCVPSTHLGCLFPVFHLSKSCFYFPFLFFFFEFLLHLHSGSHSLPINYHSSHYKTREEKMLSRVFKKNLGTERRRNDVFSNQVSGKILEQISNVWFMST